MGGNNTFAAGKIVAYRWRTVDVIDGVKVLELVDGGHKLPEEAHSSRMYIQRYKDGRFSQLRIYDREHRLRFELACHREPRLDPSGNPVLHYHLYSQPGFVHGPAHLATEAMRRRFARYMVKGEPK